MRLNPHRTPRLRGDTRPGRLSVAVGARSAEESGSFWLSALSPFPSTRNTESPGRFPGAVAEGDLELAPAVRTSVPAPIPRTHALRTLNRRAGTHSEFPEMVGSSPAMLELLRQLEHVCRSNVPVLITGESGSGKELIAAALHRNGKRAAAPFVPINCSALSESLLESELFGHAKGAFSGAISDHRGLFEAACGGTLFLDEVGDMGAAMQARLLRVLETGRVRRVGETHEREVNVRIVSATHRDVDAMVVAGELRADLLYRLRVVQLSVPPLRERAADIPMLVIAILGKVALEMGRGVPLVSAAALAAFSSYAWPGNVRELSNEIRRALVFAESVLDLEHVSPRVRGEARAVPLVAPGKSAALPEGSLTAKYGSDLKSARRAFDQAYLTEVLAAHDGVIARAAASLDLDRGYLSRLLKKHGLSPRGDGPQSSS